MSGAAGKKDKEVEVEKKKTLADQKVHFMEEEIDKINLDILTKMAADLGAEVVEGPADAKYIFTNPCAPAYKERNPALPKASATVHILPYHWLTQSHYFDRLESYALDPAKPVFFHPDRSLSHRPMRMWVSVNVARNQEEASAEIAYANVSEVCVRGGGILTLKRAIADVLVVDENSKFFGTVKAERERHGRLHQKFGEREWLEDCFANRKVVWKTRGEEEAGVGEEDSFGEEEVPKSKGAGPGRPTGKPRVEYSKQDDDFLCRWLAAFTKGARHSRKTYQILAAASDRFPLAAHHSAQSWHERFKKNNAVFERQVVRLQADGIDESLKTAAEREKTRQRMAEAEAKEAGAGAPHISAAATTDTAASAGPSTTTATKTANSPRKSPSKVSPEKEQQETNAAASSSKVAAPAASTKRQLVSLDEESQSQPSAPSDLANGEAQMAADTAQQERADPATEFAATEIATEVTITEVAVAETEIVVPETIVPLIPEPRRNLRTDSMDVDESLGPSQLADPESRAETQQSVQTNSSNGHDTRLAGAETQAILSDFQKARAAAAAMTSTIEESLPAPASASASASTSRLNANANPARGLSVPRSPRPERNGSPSKRARHTEPIKQGQFPDYDAMNMPAPPQPTARVPRISEAGENGRQRVTLPVKLNFQVIGITADTSTEESDAATSPVSPSLPFQRSSHLQHAASDTPSPGRQRSTLREGLVHSSSREKAPRSSRGSHRPRHRSPDTVYSTPAIPAAIPRLPSATTSPVASMIGRRAPSPEMSRSERYRAQVEGQALMLEQREMYKRNMERLCEKYGVGIMELHRAVDRVRVKGEGSLGWGDIEARLDRAYQVV